MKKHCASDWGFNRLGSRQGKIFQVRLPFCIVVHTSLMELLTKGWYVLNQVDELCEILCKSTPIIRHDSRDGG